MSLVACEPKNGLEFLFDPGNFFDSAFSTGSPDSKTVEPRVNVMEGEDGFTLHVAVPGMKSDDIEIEIKDDTLTLSGKSMEDKDDETRNYRIREFSRRSFRRVFTLGQWVDPDGITAKVENGLLEICLPKKEEAKPKKVKIN
ncbi:MAG: Hsp20/alpha crystallin family protein [Nitrospinales bacterium]